MNRPPAVGENVAAGNLTFRQMQIFLVASKSRSFREAAAELGIAQPTLSAAIARVETLLGVTVFDRSTRRVNLTPEGQRLAVAAADLVYTYETAIGNLRNGGDRGARIRFALTEAMCGAIAPAALARFRAKDPSWVVSLHDVDADSAVSLVQDGSVDFALVNEVPRIAGMHYEVLGQVCLNIVYAPALKSHDRAAFTWRDLEGLPVILAGHIKRRGFLRALWEHRGYDIRPVHEVNDMATAICLAAEGFGYLVAHNTLLPRRRDPRLVARPLAEPDLQWPLQVVHVIGRPLALPQRALVDCFRAELGELAEFKGNGRDERQVR